MGTLTIYILANNLFGLFSSLELPRQDYSIISIVPVAVPVSGRLSPGKLFIQFI